jgi:hypothetical protein
MISLLIVHVDCGLSIRLIGAMLNVPPVCCSFVRITGSIMRPALTLKKGNFIRAKNASLALRISVSSALYQRSLAIMRDVGTARAIIRVGLGWT